MKVQPGMRLMHRSGTVWEVVRPGKARLVWLTVLESIGNGLVIIGKPVSPRFQVFRATLCGQRVWLVRDRKSVVVWLPEQDRETGEWE